MEGKLDPSMKDLSERESSPLIRTSGGEPGSFNHGFLDRRFEAALDSAGVGLFHVILLLVSGWALASDSVEVQGISFVTPKLSNNSNDTVRPDIILTKVCTTQALS